MNPFTASDHAPAPPRAAYNASFEHLHGSPGQVAKQILVDGQDRLRHAGC